MVQSQKFRYRRNRIAEWLCDAYGENEDSPVVFRKDAADFLKYLTAHGLQLCSTSNNGDIPDAL